LPGSNKLLASVVNRTTNGTVGQPESLREIEKPYLGHDRTLDGLKIIDVINRQSPALLPALRKRKAASAANVGSGQVARTSGNAPDGDGRLPLQHP
jgi:hypothetical protein